MGDFSWSKAAFTRYDKFGNQDIPTDWAKFENDYMTEFNSVKAQARKLLAQGKRAEAVKMLNDTPWKIWEEAAKKLAL